VAEDLQVIFDLGFQENAHDASVQIAGFGGAVLFGDQALPHGVPQADAKNLQRRSRICWDFWRIFSSCVLNSDPSDVKAHPQTRPISPFCLFGAHRPDRNNPPAVPAAASAGKNPVDGWP